MNRRFKQQNLVIIAILSFSTFYPRSSAQDTPAVHRQDRQTAINTDYALVREVPAGLFRKKRKVRIQPQSSRRRSGPAILTTIRHRPSGRYLPVEVIRRQAESVARMGLPYSFGGCSPADGGMDCSGSIKFLLSSLGYHDVPRTSYAQYDWMRNKSRIHRSKAIDARRLRPGDLIFWGGTYDSGHKVSHVMLYMGQSPNGKMYMFGARGKAKRGVSGAGVDVFELRPGNHKNLIGYGSLPHLPAG